jgi:hypothetical protein
MFVHVLLLLCIAIVQPAIVSDTRKKDQSEVDAVIIKALAKVSCPLNI